MTKTVSIITLGCKVNYTDTEQIAKTLAERGYAVIFNYAPSDLFIVNTCIVTARADYQSRQAIRRVTRTSPDVPVIVTGCSAPVFGQRIHTSMPNTVVIDPGQPDAVLNVVRSLIGSPNNAHRETSPKQRTRAFLKIQEGCNSRCAYCIVPRARGAEQSRRPQDVLHEISNLIEKGYREIVLVGIHLGRYGTDLGGSINLPGLLRSIDSLDGEIRIRLSSIEPMELTDSLLGAMAKSRVTAPHLHVPLQSGDDSVLSSMGRPYKRSDFEQVFHKALDRLKNPAIGLDVMVGFPGEGDREFRNTVDVIDRLPIAYLHVFPFSKRPGTRAADFENQVFPRTKRERARILRELGMEKKREFIERCLGTETNVLVERHENGLVRGKSENYLNTYLPGNPDDVNRFIRVILEKGYKDGVYGRRYA